MLCLALPFYAKLFIIKFPKSAWFFYHPSLGFSLSLLYIYETLYELNTHTLNTYTADI